ncbi:ABC-F family ATP-binding cassette domain-containing protein [Candidatus Saccharibacteria bacterium]|nr:ABC-F family ATP-binding cassette domain-containing protein [Candidatus Saccharibacteria bacterium]
MYKLTHIYKSFADKQVLSDINLTLHSEVVALIGENGAGKTTLLKILLGEIEPDDGRVQQNGAVGYVPQHPNFGKTIADCFDATIEQWRIDIALEDVRLEKPMSFLTSKLSGGQKTRLSIAMVLATNNQPDVLLLDEPTNNLDAEALKWLKFFVKNFRGAVVIVSHDRSFINDTATKILELSDGKLNIYPGDYDAYKDQKELEAEQALAAYEAGLEERKRLQKVIVGKRSDSDHTHKHIKRSDNDKAQRDYFKNRVTRGLGQQVRALQTRLDQLDDLEKPDATKSYEVTLSGKSHDSKLLIKFEDVEMDFLAKKKLPNLEVNGRDRVRVCGVNGSGKSTLLRLAAGILQADCGDVIIGQNISVGYLSQDTDGLDTQLTAIENLEQTEAHITDIYREARALGLKPDELKKKPSELSRGQQTKLSFAKLLLSRHDLLILDEPTNHLDIPTRESIERALHNYQGAMLFTSHDEYFAQSIRVTKEINLDIGEKHEKQ